MGCKKTISLRQKKEKVLHYFYAIKLLHQELERVVLTSLEQPFMLDLFLRQVTLFFKNAPHIKTQFLNGKGPSKKPILFYALDQIRNNQNGAFIIKTLIKFGANPLSTWKGYTATEYAYNNHGLSITNCIDPYKKNLNTTLENCLVLAQNGFLNTATQILIQNSTLLENELPTQKGKGWETLLKSTIILINSCITKNKNKEAQNFKDLLKILLRLRNNFSTTDCEAIICRDCVSAFEIVFELDRNTIEFDLVNTLQTMLNYNAQNCIQYLCKEIEKIKEKENLSIYDPQKELLPIAIRTGNYTIFNALRNIGIPWPSTKKPILEYAQYCQTLNRGVKGKPDLTDLISKLI